jgi:hypothetical protein
MTTKKSCCSHSTKHKKCIRSKDNKKFTLPRRFSKKKCIDGPISGFSMKSSCAPYTYCKKSKRKSKNKKIKKKRSKNIKKTSKKKSFFFNPDDPKRSFDVFIDKNPKDTIPITYTTVLDVKQTIRKLERLYKQKKYTHKRIWQVGMILKVRLEVIQKKNPKIPFIRQRTSLAKKYFIFLGKRTKLPETERYKATFKI